MSEKYRIKNMNGFAKKILSIACNDIGIDQSEYKNYINVDNVKQIVKIHSEQQDDDFYVDDDVIEKICDDLQNWVLGVQLSKMCSDGTLDCYWDDVADCMVFKVADTEKGEN